MYSYWDFFCNNKWNEHQDELAVWEGRSPDYTKEEYIKKNKKFLRNLFLLPYKLPKETKRDIEYKLGLPEEIRTPGL